MIFLEWLYKGLIREAVTWFEFCLRMEIFFRGPELEPNEVYSLHYSSTIDGVDTKVHVLTPESEKASTAHLFLELLEGKEENERIRVYDYKGHLIFKIY